VLKVADVMRIMNCSRTSAYELMYRLGPVRFGERGIRLPAEKLTRFVEAQRRTVQLVEPPAVVERAPEPTPRVVEQASIRTRRSSSGVATVGQNIEGALQPGKGRRALAPAERAAAGAERGNRSNVRAL
jgi:hypothetical protein